LKDPESLVHASRGVSAVISTASSTFSRQTGDSIETVDRLGQRNAVDAARSAGDYPNHRARIYGAGRNPVSFVSY